MKKIIIALIVLGSLIAAYTLMKKKDVLLPQNSYKRENGYVPDEQTAIKIAEAIWLPIYGEMIYEEKPFKATLKNDSIWIVEGTINDDKAGGTAYAEIQKMDCKVLKVIHGK